MKALKALVLASVLLLGGCSQLAGEPIESTPDIVPVQTESTAATSDTQPSVTESTTLPSYSEVEIGEVVIDPQDYSLLVEAEEGALSGYAAAVSRGEGYSGSGYVTGLSLPDSRVTLTFPIESPAHYSITVCAAAQEEVSVVLVVDGYPRGRLYFEGDGSFEAVKLENVYLSPPESIITLSEPSGELELDFVLVESSDEVYSVDYSLPGTLSFSSRSQNTVRLYRYLCELYGETVLTAQQCTQGSNEEITAIANATGRYPAIRFGELMGYSSGEDTGDIELSIEYWQEGGLVGYVWNWLQNGSLELSESGFDLSAAVTAHDVARLSQSRLNQLLSTGGISPECLCLIQEIDLIAEQLKRLKELDIPVIFRPLPVASGGQFWWGCDKESYLWLYRLIYDRLNHYHMLDNLIWVWNAQDPDWYVGDEYCDIISADIYDFSKGQWDNQSHINPLLRLLEISNDKPCAISECNVLPGPANIARDKAYWLYASVWSGEYAIDGDGGLFCGYISREEWILFYNCSQTTARDELSLSFRSDSN